MGQKNLVKYQIPLLNFSKLNVLIFKTFKIEQDILYSVDVPLLEKTLIKKM